MYYVTPQFCYIIRIKSNDGLNYVDDFTIYFSDHFFVKHIIQNKSSMLGLGWYVVYSKISIAQNKKDKFYHAFYN